MSTLQASGVAGTSPPARLIALDRTAARVGLFLAFALLTGLSLVALYRNSLVVDGTRYFWLDDDQMISMRYARNLVEGHGLVWNPGERVEGYTNPLWTLVMAAVHLTPLAEASAAVAVKTINWGLACTVLLLSARLFRLLQPHAGVAIAGLLITLALNLDLVYWSAHGFETTLLTAVFLLATVRLIEESHARSPRPGTYLVMSLLPLIRSDAYPVWGTLALLAFGISTDRRRTIRLLGLSLLVPIGHVLLRRLYYGDWLPNTYYLKVSGIPHRATLGWEYLERFLHNYSLALGAALLAAAVARDRHRWLLLAGVPISGIYIVWVGEDLFDYSRFLAHLVPVLLVLAFAGAAGAGARRPAVEVLGVVLLGVVLTYMVGAWKLSHLDDENGDPASGLVAGLLLHRHTDANATVAVLAAGNVSYFSHRYTIDMLGKSDAHVAREAPRPGGYVGHNKFDPNYSLGLEPDLVVAFWAHKLVIDPFAIEEAAKGGDVFITAVVDSSAFQTRYRPNPVPIRYLREHNAIYVRDSSPELARLSLWREPRLGAQ